MEVLPTQPPCVACKQSYTQQTAAAGHAAITLAVQQPRLKYLTCTCTVTKAALLLPTLSLQNRWVVRALTHTHTLARLTRVHSAHGLAQSAELCCLPGQLVLAVTQAPYQTDRTVATVYPKAKKFWNHFSIYACHLCARAMLIFSVSFQF